MKPKLRNICTISVLLCLFILFQSPVVAKTQSVNLKGFDRFVKRILQEWQVPGVAVTLVKDGRVILARGYGFRSLDEKLPVTGKTLFAIGSCTKAFTATAVGILADRGKLKWDDPVSGHMKNFKLKDPVATREMTAVDLMCHRSGLPRHDFSWYNAPADRRELYRRLAFLEPSEPFRYRFQYNNFMFMTAGLLVEELTGQRWEEFVAQNIFTPLGMSHSNFSVSDSRKSSDYSLPYSLKEERVTAIPLRNIDNMGPAGCINSCALDMAQWLFLNLNGGKWNGVQIVGENTLAFIHTPQMVNGSGISEQKEFLFTAYGLGWSIGSYRGAPLINHGGGIDGFISLVSLLPRHNAGVVILTNCDTTGGYVTGIISRNLYDRVLGKRVVDWNSRMREKWMKAKEEDREAGKKKDSQQVKGTSPSHPPDAYCGRYHNPGYGELKIKNENNLFKMIYNNIEYNLTHYHYDIFKAVPELDEDRSFLASFATDTKGMIQSVSLPFQPGVSDIVFSRMAEEKMKDPEFLKRFTGSYQLSGQDLIISLSDDQLVLRVSGQPNYELVPYRGNEFTLKNVTGYSVEFVLDESGSVSALKLIQPNGVFTANRVK